MLPLDKPFKKAVILGAGGFIGINLAHSLVAQGFDLVCFDRAISPHWPGKATAIIGDFASMPVELMRQLDHALVFHLISSCRPSSNTVQAADEVSRDLVTTIRYLEETRTRVLRWVFLSSGGTVYGHNNHEQISESSPTAPICSYGVIKLAIERYFALYRQLHHVDYVVVRLANPYGPWQDPLQGQGIIAAMLYKALKGDAIVVWGDGENVRDYIYVSDATQGILAAASGQSGEVYNIGTGIGTSINQVIKIISETLNIQLRINYTDSRSVDVRRNVLNPTKLLTSTGWRSTTGLDAGAVKTVAWIKKIASSE